MVEPVSPLLLRRLVASSLLVIFCVATWLLWEIARAALRPTAIYTGVLLLALVLALTLFNARKKLPFLPLARAATWLQVHIYLGWFCLFLFFLHLHFRIPQGALEIVLALVFLAVIFSGVFGLVLSRKLPGRMARSGEPLLYERIPAFRRRIQDEVEQLVRCAERETESSTLADFYVQYLRRFFVRVPHAWRALAPATHGLHPLLAELDALDRYLNEREKAIARELRDWIETKQNLDFQYASQRLLKLWLFVHIPLTYSLILLGLAHGLIAALYAWRW